MKVNNGNFQAAQAWLSSSQKYQARAQGSSFSLSQISSWEQLCTLQWTEGVVLKLLQYVSQYYMWLFKFKLIKIKLNLKFSFSFALAMFQVLNSHIWLVATMLGKTSYRSVPSSQKVLLGSAALEHIQPAFLVHLVCARNCPGKISTQSLPSGAFDPVEKQIINKTSRGCDNISEGQEQGCWDGQQQR